jgi:hypothetical protein
VNANVVAINVVGRMLFDRGIELESDAVLQFAEKAVGGPAVAQEEKFQAGALAMFAQNIGIAKQFRNPFDHRQNLIPAYERIQDARPRYGSVESPPATRSEKPTSGFPPTVRVIAVRPTSLISG